MRPLARVIFDEAHRQAWSTRPEIAKSINPTNPNDAGYVTAATDLSDSGFTVGVHESGAITASTLSEADVFVVLHFQQMTVPSQTMGASKRCEFKQIVRLGGVNHRGWCNHQPEHRIR